MANLEELKSVRLQKLNNLKNAGMNPFTAICSRTHTLQDAENNFESLEKEGKEITLAGRVMSLRGQGAILFFNLDDGTGVFQGLLKKDEIKKEVFSLFFDNIDIADFIEVTGTLFVTKTGAHTILVKKWNILTKALAPLPDKWHGLVDQEERLRKRYLDLLTTPELKDVFTKKAKFWEATRNFMTEKGFLEVETPTLEVTTGGAEANPFRTHHKDFDLDVYLRISVGELWQKRLMAAGFPKTFEIGRVYRNEGSSPEHLQEFTNMEFYWAYANYKDGMKLVQEMYQKIAQDVFGKTKFTARGHEFDLSGDWDVVDYRDEILKQTNIDILSNTEEEMKKKLEELGVEYEGDNKERLMDTLWKYCRKNIAGPVFLIHHPKLVSPLAKATPDNPELTERFQVIIAGSEVGNGFSELNDPIDQKERFELQQKLIDSGDSEAMMPEWEFVDMLEHGMPPTCGFGFGERLFSFLIDKPIRETQLFPLLKPKEDVLEKKKESSIAVVVVNSGAGLEKWQEMNTVAHLNAAFGARTGKSLFTQDTIESKDKTKIKLNTKIAILIKATDSSSVLRGLSIEAKNKGLEVDEFTREMIETTNDKKIIEITATKDFEDIEYLGVLVYGSKTKVEKLTSDLNLLS